MTGRVVHVELLLNREVRDPSGRHAGRIEEIRARREGDEIVVEAYHLGSAAMLERLAAPVIHNRFLRALGVSRHGHGRRVRWDQMDLTDPAHPLLRCAVEELPKLAR